jgi:hypothetical protein
MDIQYIYLRSDTEYRFLFVVKRSIYFSIKVSGYDGTVARQSTASSLNSNSVLEFLNNTGIWGLGPCRNKVVVPGRQATQPGGIDSLESILGLLKSLKIRDQRYLKSVLT